MVTFVGVFHYRRDPNCIGAQASDVIEVLLNSLECSTAVVLQIGALLGRQLPRECKAICEELGKNHGLFYGLQNRRYFCVF